MPPETKNPENEPVTNPDVQQVLTLVKTLRTEWEDWQKKGRPESEFKAVEDRINARIDQLETKLTRPPAPQMERGDGPTPAVKAYLNFLRKGTVSPEEAKVLTLSDDTATGYLAPAELVMEIIKGITEWSPIRQYARVRQTSQTAVKVPKKTGTFAATRVAEIATRTETTGYKIGKEEMSLPEAYALVKISKQDLEDSAFNLEGEIQQEASEQFSVLEGKECVSGTGVGECEGLLTNTEVAYTPSGDANLIKADGLIDIFYAVKDGYARNGTWFMRRTTTGAIRKLKDPVTGAYLWQPGLIQGQPESILGRPIAETVDMPAVAANAFPVIFGDLRRGYWLVDRRQMSAQRLVELYTTAGMIGFLFSRRYNGQVVLAEAFRKLKIATS